MTTLLGNDYLAWIDSATPTTFYPIKGQGTLTDNRSQSKIDTSDKTTGAYNTGAFGNIEVSLDLDIRVKLPDANGYTRFETMANTRTPFNLQIRKNGLAGVAADSIFTCLVYGSISSRTFNKDGTVDVKASISLADAPTVDTLQ